MRVVVLTLVVVTWAVLGLAQAGRGAQRPGQPGAAEERRGQARSEPASVSMRGPAWGRLRTAVEALLGWHVGVPLESFHDETFFDAAQKADALGVATVAGSSTQQVSAQIPKNLDYGLAPGEVRAVQDRLAALRLRMSLYSVPAIGEDEARGRRIFELAKNLDVDTLVVAGPPRGLPLLEALAGEYKVNVALSGSPKTVLAALRGRSERLGAYADIGNWMEEGIEPIDGVALLKDRLLAVRLSDRSALGPAGQAVPVGRGVAGTAALLGELYRLQITPTLIVADAGDGTDVMAGLSASLEGFEAAAQQVAAQRVAHLSRETPIKRPDRLTPEQRQQIAEAVPSVALAKPRQPRRLLVFDANIGYGGKAGGHRSIPAANMVIELFEKRTGAYEAVFSNDLAYFTYDKIRQFDAVFLNNTVGMIFVDPEVRDGLIRFVREGGGLAAYHGTSHASMDWPEFGAMLGAVGGTHRDPTEVATVRLDDPTSPLTAAFAGEEFVHQDEFYRFADASPFSRDKLRVLMSIDVQKTDMNQGRDCRRCVRADHDYALSWIRSYGKGRVFYTSLGHAPAFFAVAELNEFFLAGIQFALGDLEADTTPSANLDRTSRR